MDNLAFNTEFDIIQSATSEGEDDIKGTIKNDHELRSDSVQIQDNQNHKENESLESQLKREKITRQALELRLIETERLLVQANNSLLKANDSLALSEKSKLQYSILAELGTHPFLKRDELIELMKKANFDRIPNQRNKLGSGTAEKVSDKSSITNTQDRIQMSSFNMKQLNNSMELTLKILNFPGNTLFDTVCSFYEDINLQLFMDQEKEALLQFQIAISYWSAKLSAIYDESKLQILFQIFIEGMLANLNNNFKIYDITNISLKAKITINRPPNSEQEALVELKGKSDIAIGLISQDVFDINHLLSQKTIIGELKLNNGPLAGSSSEVWKATSQLLGEMIAIKQMREANNTSTEVDKSFLCDFNSIRMMLGINELDMSKNDVSNNEFYISSLLNKPDEIILIILLLMSDLSKDFIIKNFLPSSVLVDIPSLPLPDDDIQAGDNEQNNDEDYNYPNTLQSQSNTKNNSIKRTLSSSFNNYGLKLRNPNIMYIDDDRFNEEEKMIDKQLRASRWNAAQLINPLNYLSAENLNYWNAMNKESKDQFIL